MNATTAASPVRWTQAAPVGGRHAISVSFDAIYEAFGRSTPTARALVERIAAEGGPAWIRRADVVLSTPFVVTLADTSTPACSGEPADRATPGSIA